MRICQSHLGPRVLPGADWANLSSILAQVLGPLFLDLDRHAQHWQRARGSEPIAEFGKPMHAASPDSAVEVKRLIESFSLGARNLPEVWGMILPPSTLVELRRLARQDTAAFRMPDETWARIVYDFALAHRLQHHQQGPDAARINADLPRMGGILCAEARECLTGGSGTAAGAAMPRVRKHEILSHCAMALAGSFQSVGKKGETFMWDQVEETLRQSTVRVLSQFANLLPGALALVVALLF